MKVNNKYMFHLAMLSRNNLLWSSPDGKFVKKSKKYHNIKVYFEKLHVTII